MKINKREKLFGIIAIVIAGALMLDSIFISPLLARLSDANKALASATEAHTDAQSLFNSEILARRKWNDMAGDTLKSDASTAEQQLLNRVRDWAGNADLALSSLKPERNEKEQTFDKVTIRATANGSMQQIGRFLFALNTSKVPVRVSDLQISSRKDGADDLMLQLGICTIYNEPEAPKTGQPTPARGGVQ